MLQGDFDLSKFQLGVLAAMFMVGLMIASVLLTQFMGAVSPFRLIGEPPIFCLEVWKCPPPIPEMYIGMLR